MQQLTEKERENALNEIRILASIKHPNIISYKEAFIDDATNNLWYFIFLFILNIFKLSNGVCFKWRFVCRNS